VSLFGGAAKKKRHVFFSFHYADVMRVNNVRQSGQFKTDKTDGREIEGFYDKSLWESKKLTGDASLKTLIREGVERTSVVCVLAGANTWRRRWVRYEIARAVIDKKGLFAIHINGINHHERRAPDERSDNPCRYMGVARDGDTDKFYLCERNSVDGSYQWVWYKDYTLPVSVPKFMKPPAKNVPVRLSEVTIEYDWAQQNGHANIGWWSDLAAQEAGYS
jgi:hypothetical protein